MMGVNMPSTSPLLQTADALQQHPEATDRDQGLFETEPSEAEIPKAAHTHTEIKMTFCEVSGCGVLRIHLTKLQNLSNHKSTLA